MTEWYQRRKLAGVCVRCGKVDDKVASGKVYCAECSEKTLESQRGRRRYLRQQNRCINCGLRDPKTEQGHQVCGACALKIKAQPARQPNKERYKERSKQLREQRRAEQVCTVCGGEIDEAGYRICSGCRRKAREKRNNAGIERD